MLKRTGKSNLIKNVEKTESEVIRDYSILSLKKTRKLLENLSFDGLLDLDALARLLIEKSLEENISAKGYRFLSHLTLNEKEISEIVEKFKSIDVLFDSQIQWVQPESSA
jgi:DNA integrity scanning protein DisA with diadenylate cyclase activity